MIENLSLEPRVVHRGKSSHAEFAARLRAEVQRDFRKLRTPEGDVAPRAWFYLGHRIMEIHLVPDWFQSRGTKDFLTQQIVKMVQMVPLLERFAPIEPGASGVNYVGLVYTQYRSHMNFDDATPEQLAALERNEVPPGFLPPAQDPEADEVVSAIVIDREIAKAWHAVIKRHRKRPPRLEPWQDMEQAWGLPTGLMIDPIMEAMR